MQDIKSLVESRLNHIKKVVSKNRDLVGDIVKLPKYEFHLHLGGSIRRRTILDLAQKNNITLPASFNEIMKAEILVAILPKMKMANVTVFLMASSANPDPTSLWSSLNNLPDFDFNLGANLKIYFIGGIYIILQFHTWTQTYSFAKLK